jgi:hypothetical protein
MLRLPPPLSVKLRYTPLARAGHNQSELRTFTVRIKKYLGFTDEVKQFVSVKRYYCSD